jgi:predicted DNA binding CopG/RHH family protein
MKEKKQINILISEDMMEILKKEADKIGVGLATFARILIIQKLNDLKK